MYAIICVGIFSLPLTVFIIICEHECVCCYLQYLNLCAQTMHLHSLSASICTLTQRRFPRVCISENIKRREQLRLHMGKAMHTLVFHCRLMGMKYSLI